MSHIVLVRLSIFSYFIQSAQNYNYSLVFSYIFSTFFYNTKTIVLFCKDKIGGDYSNFDTSKVINMQYMFCDCTALTTLDLGSEFCTSNVENMYRMFYCCYKLILNCSTWNLPTVTNEFNAYAPNVIPPTWT